MRKSFLFLALGLALVACNEKNNPDEPFVPKDTTIVVVGQELVPEKDYYDAVVWLDGERLCLSDGSHDAFCNAVHAEGNHLYIVGCEAIGELVDDGWYEPYNENNGILWSFSLDKTDEITRTVYGGVSGASSALDVTYAAGKAHACGFDTPPSDSFFPNRRALWWKGEEKIELTDGSSDAMAYCITSDGDDVYVGGYIASPESGSIGSAVIWKNGEVQRLTEGVEDLCKVSRIVVKNGHVYAAGAKKVSYGSWAGAIWIDGEMTLFTEEVGTEVYGLHVYEDGSWLINGNMTEAGTILACNWHSDGTVDKFTVDAYSAQGAGLLVLGDDVYSMGNSTDYDDDFNVISKGYLWKNGERDNSLTIGNPADYCFWGITAALY